MQIGDIVVICDPKHPLNNYEGKLIGFRGKKPPDDMWLLIFINDRGRSHLIPQSMVKTLPPKSAHNKSVDPKTNHDGYN